MTTTGEHLATARAALAALSPIALGALSDEELLTFTADVEGVGRLLDALRVASAAEIAYRSRRGLGEEGLSYRHGQPKVAHFLEKVTRVSQAEVSRRLRVGRLLARDIALDGTELPSPFPLVEAAVESGAIGIDSAYAIVKNLADASRLAPVDLIAAAEEQLVAEAAHKSADLIADEAIMWRLAIDPDGSEPRADRIHDKRRFVIGRTNVEGLTPFYGLAEPLFAATLRAAIGERTSPSRQPRFLDPADASCDAAGEAMPIGDGRSREQKNYDVLEGLLTAGIRADRENVGPLHSTAAVTVVVRASDLAAETGPAWLEDVREPISAALAAMIACDAGTQLIGVGDDGQPLWMGRRERYFTAKQRKALAARDGGCVMPGCKAPPSWCHAHHVVEWSRGGPTDIDNGVLLCAMHHRLIHRGAFRLRMVRGLPELLAPRWVNPKQEWIPVGGAAWRRAA